MAGTVTLASLLTATAFAFWIMTAIHLYEHGKAIFKDHMAEPTEAQKLAVKILYRQLAFIYALTLGMLVYRLLL